MVRINIPDTQIQLTKLRSQNDELKAELRWLETLSGMTNPETGEEAACIQDIREHPRDVGSHLRYADWLESQGRDDEGMDMRKRAVKLTNH